MIEHRETETRRDWRRVIAAGASVILAGLSLACSAAVTLGMWFGAALSLGDSGALEPGGEDLMMSIVIQFCGIVGLVWGISAFLIILAIRAARRARRA